MAHHRTDYAATRRAFRREVPERFNWAFDAWARDPGNLTPLWVLADGRPRRFAFAELAEHSRLFANVLAGRGGGPGERMPVVLSRVSAWWKILLRYLRSLAISVPGTTLLIPMDSQYRRAVSEASVVVTDEDNTWKVDQVLAECPSVRHRIAVGRAGGG